ncbi:unnamed protein product [Blepharisma stoltei]|uniref:P-type ATPase A domain-containing protein n=1 Tax=Blepharisma stoltei TaxID=1481888 RepID=A0AAU9JTT0_9CILI|nr:unnamed protein product [Blepharisma stoltei]
MQSLGLTSTTQGLSHVQIADRLVETGYNILPTHKPTVLTQLYINRIFILYCILFTTLMAEIANTGPSHILSHIFIILFTVALFIIKAFTRQYPEFPTIDSMVPAIRNGTSNMVESKFLVRGDVIQIQEPMTIPADIRLVNVGSIKPVINGCSLFGKEGVHIGEINGSGNYYRSPNMAFQGSIVESGKGLGIVLKTGKDTFLAKLSKIDYFENDNDSKWLAFVGILWIGLVLFRYGFGTRPWYVSAIALLLIFIKMPHYWNFSKGINTSSHSHVLLKNNIYPKNTDAYKELTKIKTLFIDTRYALLNSQKEVEQVFIEGKLMTASEALKSKPKDFKLLIDLIDVVLKSKMPNESEEDSEDDQYKAPFEKALINFLADLEISKKDYDTIYKINMSEKNKFTLAVINDKDKLAFSGILLGDAKDVLKNSKEMYVNGKLMPVDISYFATIIDDFANHGIKCLALAYSDVLPQSLEKIEESGITTDMFNFSLIGILGIREHTNNASQWAQLASDLGINIVAIGPESKEYLVNLSLTSGFLKHDPEVYDLGKLPNDPMIYFPDQIKKNPRIIENNRFSMIPSLSTYDTCHLIENYKDKKSAYFGRNSLALKISQISMTHKTNTKEVKAISDLVMLSDKGVDDFLNAVIELKNARKVTLFIFQAVVGSLIPCFTHILLSLYSGLVPSSFGILCIDFGVPVVTQFLYVSFPSTIRARPIRNWICITLAALYSFFYISASDHSYEYSPHTGYFFTIFLCFGLHNLWVQVSNWGKMYTAWTMIHMFVFLKCVFFLGFCLIAKISSRVFLAPIKWEHTYQGVIFYAIQLFLIRFIG